MALRGKELRQLIVARVAKATGAVAPRPQRQRVRGGGFTIMELLLAMATLGTIASLAVPAYRDYLEKAKIAKAVTDIRTLEKEIRLYETDQTKLPDSLSDVGRESLPDPWGAPYVYLKVASAKNQGALRKDRFLVPLNSDYDLYSKGRDGKSKAPLNANDSWDDILRANDGGYVGLASEF
jgi:general secretion pathway protein G